MTVGSVCSFILRRRRLWKTQEMRGRSTGWPVSFSTIEASVTACSSPRVTSGARCAWALCHSSRKRPTIACTMPVQPTLRGTT